MRRVRGGALGVCSHLATLIPVDHVDRRRSPDKLRALELP